MGGCGAWTYGSPTGITVQFTFLTPCGFLWPRCSQTHAANICRWSCRVFRLTCTTQFALCLFMLNAKICPAKWKINLERWTCSKMRHFMHQLQIYLSNLFYFFSWLPHTPPFFSFLIHQGIVCPSQCILQFFFGHDSICSTNMDLALLGCIMIPVNPERTPSSLGNGLSHMFLPLVSMAFKIPSQEHDDLAKQRNTISAVAQLRHKRGEKFRWQDF